MGTSTTRYREKEAVRRELKFHQHEHRKVTPEQASEAERLNRGFEMLEEQEYDGEEGTD